MRSLVLVSVWCLAAPLAHGDERGFVESNAGKNRALVVGVAHNLPGIGIDVDNMNAMAANPFYQFKGTTLMNGEGTVAAVAENLTTLAAEAEDDGTLLFYFTGHGNRGIIYPQDRTMKIGEVRAAVEKGREAAGPLARLVMIFDSCYAGSLLDPLAVFGFAALADERAETAAFVDAVAGEMTRGAPKSYWNKLFVFAACRANETSLAGGSGSVFTNAMIKAFDESMMLNRTMNDFVAKTQEYTKGHHPVARFDPPELGDEVMKP